MYSLLLIYHLRIPWINQHYGLFIPHEGENFIRERRKLLVTTLGCFSDATHTHQRLIKIAFLFRAYSHRPSELTPWLLVDTSVDARKEYIDSIASFTIIVIVSQIKMDFGPIQKALKLTPGVNAALDELFQKRILHLTSVSIYIQTVLYLQRTVNNAAFAFAHFEHTIRRQASCSRCRERYRWIVLTCTQCPRSTLPQML